MATRDDMEPIGGFKAKPAKSVDDKPVCYGTLITRVMVTEREPLVSDERGLTPGQMIDRRLDAMRESWRDYPPGERQPEIHSITLELPTDY